MTEYMKVSVLMEEWGVRAIWHIIESADGMTLPPSQYATGGWFRTWRTYCGLTDENSGHIGPIGPEVVELTRIRRDTGRPIFEDTDNCKNCIRVFQARYLMEIAP